jgi:hypothetical protein
MDGARQMRAGSFDFVADLPPLAELIRSFG